MLSSNPIIEVPVEATAFLGAVAGFVVLLFVLFLYLNKKLCFYTAGVIPCCDEYMNTTTNNKLKQLGAAYNYGDDESSSDSEVDVTNRLSTSKSYPSSLYHQLGHAGTRQLGPSRSPSQYSAPDNASTIGGTIQANGDLISLAEKGRVVTSCNGDGVCGDGDGTGVCVNGVVSSASSSSSSSGSTTSGDDDLLTHRSLRHRDPRYRQMSPSSSPYHNNYTQDCGESVGVSLLMRCGCIEAGFAYDLPTRTLTIHVLQARDIPTKDRTSTINTQVRVVLLPSRKQKHKTRIRPGDNPQFNEAFVFNKINPDEVQQLGVRLRLYLCERMRREKMLGEVIVPFASINLTLGNTFWLTLEPRANLARSESHAEVSSLTRSDSTGSNHSVHSGLSELLIGLQYNGTTGRMAVEVIKGSHFRSNDEMRGIGNSRAPDTYVKLMLMSSSGVEIAHSKTSIRRGQPNPLFKETFMFQVALFQLPDVTLMVSVYTKRTIKRKDMIGWFALGLNSSGDEQLEHWNKMRDHRGEQICRWHILLDS